MSVKILKLVNGDEVISDVEEKSGDIILTNPAKLLMFPTEAGGMSMALMPWAPYTDQKEFPISETHVLTTIEPDTNLRNEYSKQFGSGLEIVEDNPGGPKIIV